MGKVNKSQAEWKKILTPEAYYVTREKGTERAFTGKYWDSMQKGQYLCHCCGEVLFLSEHKFFSSCGWASFYQPINENVITEIQDFSHGMHRIETVCSQCDAHLGHVFDDAPQTPTGLRYCINSLSLDFKAE